jgi:hypothetical protein
MGTVDRRSIINGQRPVIARSIAVVMVIRVAPLLGGDRGPHGPDHHADDREALRASYRFPNYRFSVANP